jgi:hypothetical protein
VILLGFGGNRFTASAAEGYFTNVIRIGVKLMFFYAVLAIGMQLVAQWETALAAACKPVSAAVPMISSYFVSPSKIMTTVCSGTISTTDMLDYAALAVVFAVVTVAVPSMAADLIGGTVGLALAHAFEAAYTAQTIAKIVNPITAGLKKVSEGVASLGGGKSQHPERRTDRHPERTRAAPAPDERRAPWSLRLPPCLNPFDGQPPAITIAGNNGDSPICQRRGAAPFTE